MPAPRKMIPKEEIMKLIDQRYNQREMSEILNITGTTMTRLMREYNLSKKEKPDQIIGKRFGKLIAIERLENTKEGRKVYKCKCDCGNIMETKAKYLNNGDTRSCGCIEKDFRKYQEKNYKEALKRVGEKHGLLTIVDVEIADTKKYYKMVCKCECGNTTKRAYASLLQYDTPSCGCYAREMSSIRMCKNVLSHFKSNRNKNWYFKKNGEIIYCRSGYEVIYANHLMMNNIAFEYEPEIFKLKDAKRYTPDFYLAEEDKYIEIKGIPYEIIDINDQKHSVELFRQNHKLDIYYWEDLWEMCDLPYKAYTNYKIRADRLGIRVEDYLGKMLYLTY